MTRLTSFRRRLRRRLLAHRRLIAAVCTGLAVAAGLQVTAGPPPATTTVLTAAHDLAGGAVVRAEDLRPVRFMPGSVPRGVITSAAQAVGRTTSTPVRAGEPITDVRLLGGSMLQGYPGAVAAPVRIGDAGAVALLRIGDRVDLLAADPQTGRATVVADNAPVIALPTPGPDQSGLVSGGLLVVAVPAATGQALAAAGVSSLLSVVIRR